jgi:hypothetical protein
MNKTGTFTDVVDGLAAILQAVKDHTGQSINLQRWGTETAHIHPAAWISMKDSRVTDNDGCQVTDSLPFVLYFSTPPSTGVGEDTRMLEGIVDAALPVIDRMLFRSRETFGTRQRANRTGFTIKPQQIGDAYITTLQITVTVPWPHAIPA